MEEAKSLRFDLGDLRRFLVGAKKATYANDDKGFEVSDREKERSGHREFLYTDEEFPGFSYRDSYTGQDQFAGSEVVRLGTRPIWVMNYFGSRPMHDREHPRAFSASRIALKSALLKAPEEAPFRGPTYPLALVTDYGVPTVYNNVVEGDIKRFRGRETVHVCDVLMHELEYFGGLILQRH